MKGLEADLVQLSPGTTQYSSRAMSGTFTSVRNEGLEFERGI